MQSVHRERITARQEFLDQENHRGYDDRYDAYGCRETVVRPRLAQELRVDFDGEHPVAFPDEEGRAEIGEGAHEDKEGCRQYGGHAQRDDDLEEPLYSRAAEAFRRFKERIVDILQRARHVEEDQGEELQREHKQDTVEAVDIGNRDACQRFDEYRHDAGASQQLYPRIGANEGCRHRTENDEHLYETFPSYLVHVVEI